MNKNNLSEPKQFTMIRRGDESGVSGVGRVLDGVVFPNGKTVVCWRVNHNSIGVYESFEAFKQIHIASHPTNKTEIIWGEAQEIEVNPKPAVQVKTQTKWGLKTLNGTSFLVIT